MSAWSGCAIASSLLAGFRPPTAVIRKVNLSLFGLYPREGTPSIPPEIMLLPGKLLYQMSSWTRAIVVALAIVHAHDRSH